MVKFGNMEMLGLPDSRGELESRITNIGDFAELIAIDELYHSMGISDIHNLKLDKIKISDQHKSFYTILPINYLYGTNTIYDQLLHFPDHIIPVYLGLSIMYPSVISEEQLKYLKRFEPIGCRDERTMNFLRSCGINAYVFGCIVATFPKSEVPTQQRDTVYFVDVPNSILPYIPEQLYTDIKFVDHEMYTSNELCQFNELKEMAKKRIEEYRNHAKLIVTSRFHAAVLGLALGIPTIVTLENNFFKWSWVSKYLNIYTPDTFSTIDWDCKPIDFEPVKQQMLGVARKRIRDTYDKYNEIYSLSAVQENPNRSDASNLLYYSDALNEIDRIWSASPKSEYILWGNSDNAKKIYQHMKTHYPKAQLRAIYDMFRVCYADFAGIETICPSKEIFLRDKDIFTIVTSNTAKKAALEIFNSVEKDPSKYVLCDLNFLTQAKLDQWLQNKVL